MDVEIMERDEQEVKKQDAEWLDALWDFTSRMSACGIYVVVVGLNPLKQTHEHTLLSLGGNISVAGAKRLLEQEVQFLNDDRVELTEFKDFKFQPDPEAWTQ